MADSHDTPRRSGVSRRRFLQGAAGGAAYLASGSVIGRVAEAQAQAGTNVVVDENRLAGTNDFQISFPSVVDRPVVGYAPMTSVNKGQEVPLKLISYRSATTSATIDVFRLGYYGGAGARRVYSETVTLPDFARQGDGERPPGNFGLRSFATWNDDHKVPAGATQVSGMYLVRVRAPGGPGGQPDETHIPFVVRDDARAREVLVVIPTNSWQAYNSWPPGPEGKSLYNFNSSSAETVAGVSQDGRSRAVKVSFDRPYTNVEDDLNWVLRTEFPLIWWLEQQGYDLAYTDDYGMHSQPAQLRPPQTKTLVIAGHSEYWSNEMRTNVEAARDAGTNIASFSTNSAYWQVRYEDAGRTLVCFKTVQGIVEDGADEGRDGVNDFGPNNEDRTSPAQADDPLGSDGQKGGGDDIPGDATSTFRDPGANPGDPNAPDNLPAGRSFEGLGRLGPNRPENGLWGVMFVGGHRSAAFPLQVPGGTGDGGEFAAHPAWRHTTLANPARGTARVGAGIVGWEWDAIPRGSSDQPYGRYVSEQPPGVKRLAETNIQELNSELPSADQGGREYLVDEGRRYNKGATAQPAPGQDHNVQAVTYTAPSGALVFSAGTMQWSWGLGPHFETSGTYADPRIDVSDPNIQQATYNILADGGVQPATPSGIVLDAQGGTQPPPPAGSTVVTSLDRTPPKLKIHTGKRKPMSAGGVVRVRVTCPRAERRGCVATVALVAEIPRRTAGGARRKPRRIKLGTRRVELLAGQSKVLSFRLSKKTRRMVTRRKRVRVVVAARAGDQAGNIGRSTGVFRLYASRRLLLRDR